MIKYLIPLLLASTIAYGQEISLDKLHNHFDPMASEWDGSLPTVSPVIAKVAPLPVATPVMANRCTTDDLETVKAYFHSYGYTALLVADDKTRDNVRDEIMFNMNDNSILSLSMIYDKSLKTADGEQKPVLIKLCTEFQGVNTFGDGAAFKKFVLGQHMASVNAQLDERDQAERDRSEGKLNSSTGEPVESEPYQGDPSKVRYIPLD
jgi:hypothetical protein